MGFQFQSLAVAGPVLILEAEIGYTALGTLIGAYLLPGAAIALAAGWFGTRFGDKRVVVAGMVLMVAGGIVVVASNDYKFILLGRLISGSGAVMLNVLGTKMVVDWFEGDRTTTAMGILISSWPLGIAMSLLILGPLLDIMGLLAALIVPVVMCSLALLLITLVYTVPDHLSQKTAKSSETKITAKLSVIELRATILSGCVWCFYNVAFILPLSFGPDFLISEGVGIASAAAIVSLTSWLIIPALPFGAWFSEHIGRPIITIVGSFILIAIVIFAISLTSHYVVLFALLGILFGPAGGLIMTLPAKVLRVENRAMGMGIFFTIYYIGMGVFPAVAGYVRDVSGDPASPLWLAGVMIMFAIIALIAFTKVTVLNQNQH